MKRLIQTGIIGSIITALCCFTPVLVWIFSAIGLASMIVYLDAVLFPLLGFFILLLIIGLVRRNKRL
jgi:mercuric ion transport protein